MNQNPDPVRFEIEEVEAWNQFDNSMVTCYAVIRKTGNAGWQVAKLYSRDAAKQLIGVMQYDRSEAYKNKTIIL